MRAQLDQSVAGYRLVKRYGKLQVPLLELIQLVIDSIPSGMVPGETIKLAADGKGAVSVTCDLKPVSLVIEDGDHTFRLTMTKSHKKRSANKTGL